MFDLDFYYHSSQKSYCKSQVTEYPVRLKPDLIFGQIPEIQPKPRLAT